MDALLKQLYYDPSKGFKSINGLFKQAHAKDASVTKEDVVHFLENQEGYQLTKRATTDKDSFHPIVGPLGTWQMDLMFFDQYSTINSHFGVFLVCIEINTRFLQVIPLKSKDQFEVLRVFSEFYMEAPDDLTPQNILSDNGTEFKNGTLQAIEDELTINHFYAEPEDHRKLGMIDRVIRTMRTLIEKFMASFDTHRFIDELPNLVKNYNNSEHTSIGMSPKEALHHLDKIVELQMSRMGGDKVDQGFVVGDTVRILKKKGPFDKGTTQTYSKTLYKVEEIKGARFKLDNGKTYPFDKLQKIKDTQQAPEKAKDQVRKEEEATIAQEKQTKALHKVGVSVENVVEGPRVRQPKKQWAE